MKDKDVNNFNLSLYLKEITISKTLRISNLKSYICNCTYQNLIVVQICSKKSAILFISLWGHRLVKNT